MNWYIARISRNTLIPAVSTLETLGFEVWYPVRKEFRLYRNKRILVEKRELDDWVFISGPHPWRATGAIGIYGLLLDADGKWARVHESEISHLREAEKEKPKFRGIPRGAMIRVIAGPLASDTRTGRVTRSKPHKGRVWVEFPGSPPVELYMGQVERV